MPPHQGNGKLLWQKLWIGWKAGKWTLKEWKSKVFAASQLNLHKVHGYFIVCTFISFADEILHQQQQQYYRYSHHSSSSGLIYLTFKWNTLLQHKNQRDTRLNSTFRTSEYKVNSGLLAAAATSGVKAKNRSGLWVFRPFSHAST